MNHACTTALYLFHLHAAGLHTVSSGTLAHLVCCCCCAVPVPVLVLLIGTLSPAVIPWGVIMIMRHCLRGCGIHRTSGDNTGGRLGFRIMATRVVYREGVVYKTGCGMHCHIRYVHTAIGASSVRTYSSSGYNSRFRGYARDFMVETWGRHRQWRITLPTTLQIHYLLRVRRPIYVTESASLPIPVYNT